MLLPELIGAPIAMVVPVMVTPVGPLTSPFTLTKLLAATVTLSVEEAAEKLSCPALFRLIKPFAVAVMKLVVVLNAVPAPMVLPVESRVTLFAVTFGVPEFDIAPPTLTLTE